MESSRIRQNFDLTLRDEDRTPSRLTIALAWVAARKTRDRVIGYPFFSNPAWDVLLALYINHAKGKKESVTGICLSSRTPTTTALRWIAAIEDRGFIERRPDARDRRRVLLDLSSFGLAKMEEALDAAAESDARIGIGRLQQLG